MIRAEDNTQVQQIDLADPDLATLAKSADRIALLLSTPAVQADSNMVGSLDDFLGAVYALILAKVYAFVDRPTGPIEISAVQKRAEQLAAGQLRTDGKWMAGFHFNSALFRTAAVYHRILKIVSGKPSTKKRMGELREIVKALPWMKPEWTSEKLDRVHDEVNGLKHTARGLHHSRMVPYQDAFAAIGDLLQLVETWSDTLTNEAGVV